MRLGETNKDGRVKNHEDGDKHIVALGQDNLESLRQIMNREAKRLLHDLQ